MMFTETKVSKNWSYYNTTIIWDYYYPGYSDMHPSVKLVPDFCTGRCTNNENVSYIAQNAISLERPDQSVYTFSGMRRLVLFF